MIKLSKINTFLKSLNNKDKVYFVLYILGFLIAIGSGTGTITLFLQLINPQIDLKMVAIIVAALLTGISSLSCFALYFFYRKK